jgi:dynein intermediate chain 1
MEVIMALKLMPTVPPALAAGPSATGPPVEGGASVEAVDDTRAGGLAGGCCFAFNPFFPSQMLLGTEEGRIHAMSLDYAGQYSGTYEGHHMAVYAIVWNPFHPRVFASSSADWTVRLWDSTCPTSFMVSFGLPPLCALLHCSRTSPLHHPQVFDLGTSVGDVRWAPYSSTVLAAVTDEGKVAVWDLSTSKHEAACEQKVVKKAKCTHIAFSALAPVIIVGDSTGGVTSLKLSPNLRRVSPIPVPVIKKGEPPAPPMSRLEVEIRKLDALLLASDARISIVTPVPGAEKKGAVAVVEEAATAEE